MSPAAPPCLPCLVALHLQARPSYLLTWSRCKGPLTCLAVTCPVVQALVCSQDGPDDGWPGGPHRAGGPWGGAAGHGEPPAGGARGWLGATGARAVCTLHCTLNCRPASSSPSRCSRATPSWWSSSGGRWEEVGATPHHSPPPTLSLPPSQVAEAPSPLPPATRRSDAPPSCPAAARPPGAAWPQLILRCSV